MSDFVEHLPKLSIFSIILFISFLLLSGLGMATSCDYYINSENLTSTFTISQNDSYYCLNTDTTNLTHTAIEFGSGVQNTTLDGRGYNLDGNKTLDYGIRLWYSSNQNNTVKNCNVTEFEGGIYLEDASENRIINNALNSNTYEGIYLHKSPNNTLINNTANSNEKGIYVGDDSDNNLLVNNTANSNQYDGIYLDECSNNTVRNNIVKSNDAGVNLYSSFQNLILENSVQLNSNGIYLYNKSSSNNTIHSNWISGNTKGVHIYNASQNKIFNNFFNNSNNFDFELPFGVLYKNMWNITKRSGSRIYSSGTKIGGNYWTNPSGSGFSDTCEDSDGDGFCDKAYDLVDEEACTPGVNCSNNTDYHPLSDEYNVSEVNNPPDQPSLNGPASGGNVTGLNTTSVNVTLNVSVSDPDGDSLNVSFYNSSGDILGWNGDVPDDSWTTYNWSNLSEGNYEWYAVAKDPSGNSTQSDTWNFTIKTYPVNVTFTYTHPVSAGEDVKFNASGSNHSSPDRSFTSYEWDWDNDGVYEDAGIVANHSWSSPGTYTVTLRATDNEGESFRKTKEIEVYSPPKVNFTWEPEVGLPDKNVTFNATPCNHTYPGRSFSTYEWDWTSDGTYEDLGLVVNHSWDSTGTYNVTLNATDTEGESFTFTREIEIALPDLVITDAYFNDSYPVLGESIHPVITVKNRGNRSTKEGVMIDFNFNNSFLGYSTVDQIYYGNEIEAGESVTVEGSTLPAIYIYNNITKNVYFKVDPPSDIRPRGDINESDENNNMLSADLSVFNLGYGIYPSSYRFLNFQNRPEQMRSLEGEVETFFETIVKGGLIPSLAEVATDVTAGGKCYGMSSTSILYYEKPSLKPVDKKTIEMKKSNEDIINNIISYQAGQITLEFDRRLKSLVGDTEPDESRVYNKIKDYTSAGNPVMLLYDRHAVVAYETYDISPNYKYVSIYDNNRPGETKFAVFNYSDDGIKIMRSCPMCVPMGKQENFWISEATPLQGDRYQMLLKNAVQGTRNLFVDLSEKGRDVIEVVSEPIAEGGEWLAGGASWVVDKGKEILPFLSPVNITVVDGQGRVLNRTVNQIPGAHFMEYNHTKVVHLPTNLTYSINITGYGKGNLSLKRLLPVTNETLDLGRIENIPVNNSFKGYLDFKGNKSQINMSIDYDGDGTIDEKLNLTLQAGIRADNYPVKFSIIDEKGNVINSTVNKIPNASVKTIGNTKLFLIPNDTSYYANFSAYDSGNLTIARITQTNSSNISVVEDISLSKESEGSMSLNNNSKFTLNVDYDGDNTTDANITANTTKIEYNALPQASLDVSKMEVEEGETITFDASNSSDPDGSIKSFHWDFGDGTNGTDETVSHSYGNNGTYLVTLDVFGDGNLTDRAVEAISVVPKSVSPTDGEEDGGGGGAVMGGIPGPEIAIGEGCINITGISVSKGEMKRLEFKRNSLGITAVILKVLEEISQGNLTFRGVERADVTEEIPSRLRANRFFRVSSGQEEKIDRASIEFKVEKSWVHSQGVDKHEVNLFKYDEGWNKLPTKFNGSVNESYIYRASTDGFSLFMIAASAAAPAPEKLCSPGNRKCSGKEVLECNSTGTGWKTIKECKESCENGQCVQPPEEEKGKERGISWYWYLVLIPIIVLPIVFILLRKKPWAEKEVGKIPRKKPRKRKERQKEEATETTIGRIFENRKEFIGRKVKIEGAVEPVKGGRPPEKHWHRIKDRTGRILGLSDERHRGEGTVVGRVAQVEDRIYIEF